MVLFVIAFFITFGFKITSEPKSNLKSKKKADKEYQVKGPLGSVNQAERKS